MYRFQIIAHTRMGESIGLVGSTPELGGWNLDRCLRLHTRGDRYPIWWTEPAIQFQPGPNGSAQEKVYYKYVHFDSEGRVTWEAEGGNRWLPIDPEDASNLIIVDDGAFGYLQPYPFGYQEGADGSSTQENATGLKIVVIGSSVAVGHKAWKFKGWVELLRQTLEQQYGHQLVNVSEVGANVSRTIDRFPTVVAPEQPDVVIVALSLGNEGLAHCPPHQRRAVQRRFESGLQHLIKMIRALGARPILAGVYPNGDYNSEHYWLLRDTHERMLSWDVPILNWLSAVDDGQGRWRAGVSFDPAHPNTLGHSLMYAAIDLSLFQLDKATLEEERQLLQQCAEIPVFHDDAGFFISACIEEKRLRIVNPSPYTYTIAPYWQNVQTALQHQAQLVPGIYIAQNPQAGILPSFAVSQNGTIDSELPIPANTELEYNSAFNFFAPGNSQVIFYDGDLGILKQDDHNLWVINESDHEFNIHPMWQEVRSALTAVPPGVYEDPLQPDVPFRTMMIGPQGLESRVKAPPRSALLFRYQCPLSEISRVAILPLGDRCAVRMMLYKMEYDGPAFPFDLTRTTRIGDVADMIENRFSDMWNPNFLHFNPDERRIYHGKWTGLSFAHEVEDTDDPVNNMQPVYQRMRTRYTARAERFWYTLQHCDKVLFVRTGVADRGGAMDLVHKLEAHCQGKPFHLLILSPQSSDEFADLPNVLHYNVEFNPDRMYEDLGHWLYCTDVMRGILEALGVSSKNLFWCPPKPPRETSSPSG